MSGQERVYNNREASLLLFKCRNNTMNLADRKRFKNEATECIMCGHYIEDLKHFLLHCPAYSIDEKKKKKKTLQQLYQENEDPLISNSLYTNHTAEENNCSACVCVCVCVCVPLLHLKNLVT